ncbi:MAG: hypothetical protein OXD37_06825 [Acidimicrobiaceae bacterium]|nr:hypothetical protein [Acidimicrobiaceae bacterium]
MNETLNTHRRQNRRRSHARDAGLTSLEWLLIVAAIAGLAAVAVVLVQTVVDNTAENMADHNPRQEAADFAANELTTRWQQETPNSASEARRLNRRYTERCQRIGILYPEINLEASAKAGLYENGTEGWRNNGLPVCTLA